MDYEIPRSSKKCAVTEEEFSPGDRYFSVLIEEEEEILRFDYSRKVWNDQPEVRPEDSLAWWATRMPAQTSTGASWAPGEVMLTLFEKWQADPTQEDAVYVLALLLVQRRVFRFSDEPSEYDQYGRELLSFFSPKNEQTYQVVVVEPTEERNEELENQIMGMVCG